MKVNIRITAARLVALLVLAALLGAGMQAAMAAEQTLTMCIGTKIDENRTDPTLDSKIWPGTGGCQVYHYYTHYSPLITLRNDGEIIPWMAESYEVSDDFKSITFRLREGVTFADGTPLNASVLKFNFDRILTYGMSDFGINRSKQNVFLYYDHSEASDENTFKIYFTKGWLDMPFDLAMNNIDGKFICPSDVDPAWDIKGVLKPEKKYNGLGPYYVDENGSIPKEKIVLKRRPSWRDDLDFHKPKLDKIVLTYIEDTQIAVIALEKGDIDYICRNRNAPLDSLPKLETNSDIAIKTSPEVRMYYIRTAYWKEPFNGEDGILLRKAICYALNRTEIVEGVFNGYAIPATDAMGPSARKIGTPKCCGKGYDYDIDEAKQLLVEGGWNDTDSDGILERNGTALKDLDLIVTSSTDLIWQKDLALVIQSQLQKIGINAQIRMLEYSVYYELQKTGDFDLLMTYNMGRGVSSPWDLKGFNLKGISKNIYGNQNGTLETIAANALAAESKDERDRYLCQACDILYEEAGLIPLVYEMQYAVMNSKVKGFLFGPSSNTYFMDHVEECWIED